MLKIDGDKVRKLREDQGLTQLFLATSVEVTTDTISRWENKRYPTIKKENALKLAAALEVDIEDILLQDNEPEKVLENKVINQTVEAETVPKKGKNLLFVPLLLLLAGIAAWLLKPSSPEVNVYGRRILPAHTPVGQPFPVIIRIDIGSNAEAVSLILKEIVPPDVRIIHGSPEFSTLDRKKGSMKWIKKIDRDMVFGYLAGTEPDFQQKGLRFSGTITLRRKGQRTKKVHGDESLGIAPFHWADSNMDNKISDEEILMVYDEYSDLKELGLNIDLIEEMWLGAGYDYDQKQHKFIIKE